MIVVEAVHLGQELVQCLFPLVVATEALTTAATDGVDLVDEDDGAAALAGVGEQVPNPGRPDAHEHLDEARAGDSQEGHVSLAGDRPGQQRLARSRRADHQHSPWTHRSGGAVPLRVLQEVDDLVDLLLHPGVAGDVDKPRDRAFDVDDLGSRTSDPHDPATAHRAAELAGSTPTGVDEEAHEQEQRQEPQQGREHGGVCRGSRDRHVVIDEQCVQPGGAQRSRDGRGEGLVVGEGAGHHPFGVDRERRDAVRAHPAQQRRVRQRCRGGTPDAGGEQQQGAEYQTGGQQEAAPRRRGRPNRCPWAVRSRSRLGVHRPVRRSAAPVRGGAPGHGRAEQCGIRSPGSGARLQGDDAGADEIEGRCTSIQTWSVQDPERERALRVLDLSAPNRSQDGCCPSTINLARELQQLLVQCAERQMITIDRRP